MIKIWLDDERPVPDDSWLLCKRADEAMDLIASCQESGLDVHVSLDHDLGNELSVLEEGLVYDIRPKTGYDVALFIEERAARGIKPPTWEVHSANPVGREKMTCALRTADQLYSKSIGDCLR